MNVNFASVYSVPSLYNSENKNKAAKLKQINFSGQELITDSVKEKFGLIDKKIAEADKIAIFTHINPDGDALGSAAASKKIIKSKYKDKKVEIFVNSIPQSLKFMEQTEKFNIIDSDADITKFKEEGYNLAISVDCAVKDLIGSKGKKTVVLFDSIKNKIKIDHHPMEFKQNNSGITENKEKTAVDGTNFGDINLVCDDASSASQIILLLADHMGVKPDKDIASDVYLGLVTDTGGYRYMKKPAGVFEDASRLAKTGINASKIYAQSIDYMSKASFNLYREILNNVKFSEDGKVSYVVDDTVALKDPLKNTVSIIPLTISKHGLINGSVKDVFAKVLGYIMPNIEGVEISAHLSQEENLKGNKVTGGSICTKEGSKVSAKTIAQLFNGGGHRERAGFQKIQKPASDILQDISDVINPNTSAVQE